MHYAGFQDLEFSCRSVLPYRSARMGERLLWAVKDGDLTAAQGGGWSVQLPYPYAAAVWTA